MILLTIEFCLYIVFFLASIKVYLIKKETFQNTFNFLGKKEAIINYVLLGFIVLYVIFSAFNYAFIYRNEELTNDKSVVILTGIIEIIFWVALSIYGLSYKYTRSDDSISFEYPSKKEAKEGEIKLGTIVHNNKKKHDYYLKTQDLERHVFITGATGSGKSNFFQNFILEIKKVIEAPLLLFEFKGEYHFLQKEITDLLIYKVGKNFTINIFDPLKENSEVHAERVFDIFKSGGLFESEEYSPQMERVFVDILRRVCKDPLKRSWQKFYEESQIYLSEKIRETQDITFKASVQAVENRIRKYSLSTIAHAFDTQKGMNVKEIFDHNVLMDFKSLFEIGANKELALFFLNMVLKYLWDINIQRGSKNYKGIKHITIVEDAQYFASQHTTQRSTISAYVEDIALLLRGTGECLISLATRPAVSPEILANCGVFITFQNHMQKDYLQDLLNFDDTQRKYLSMLGIGKCLVRVSSIGVPFELTSDYVKRSWLSDEEIERNNEKIIDKIKKESIETIEKKITEAEKEIHKTQLNYCELCGKEVTESRKRYCEECKELGNLRDMVKKIDEDQKKETGEAGET